MRVLCLVFLLVLLGVSHPAHGDLYRYVDKDGVLHFTDNLADVPEDQRLDSHRFREPEEPSTPQGTEQPSPKGARPWGKEPSGEDKGEAEGKFEALKRDQEALERQYRELTVENQRLTEEQEKLRTQRQRKRFDEKVADFNKRLSAFEDKRKDLKKRVHAYNAAFKD